MGAVNTKFARDVLLEAQRICNLVGASCRLDTGSRNGHGRIVIEIDGRVRSTPLSSSPRNHDDAVRYKLSDVRRILREIAA